MLEAAITSANAIAAGAIGHSTKPPAAMSDGITAASRVCAAGSTGDTSDQGSKPHRPPSTAACRTFLRMTPGPSRVGMRWR